MRSSPKSKSDEQFEVSEIDFKQFFENLPDYGYMISPKGVILNINKTALERLGYSKNELIGKPLKKIYAPECHKKMKELFLKWKKTGKLKDEEMIIITKKGERRTVLLNADAVRDKNGKVIHSISVQKEITEQKKAEEKIMESQEMLQTIIHLLPIRIFWKDKNSVYLGCNTIFAKDAGKEKPEDLIGKDDFQMGWREQAKIYRADDKRVVESGEKKLNFEEPQTTPKGDKIWLRTSKVPLTDLKGNIIGVLGTYEDITDRRKAEEEINKRTEELERFNKLAVGRELKMIELKKRIEELEGKS